MNRQRVELIGRTTAKPEVKKSKNDKDYSKFSLAVNSKSKDEKGKEVEKATFYNILTFGKRAEKTANLKKGQLMRVVGDLEVETYTNKKDEAKADLTVFVRELQAFDTEAFK
jgi:single-strand DNA-binding protein